MVLKNNPWPGVMSYQIPDNTGPEYVFCGRSKTIDEFLPLVERYELTTLYGKSGVGKTSFLNAGIFPQLQYEGFLPVYVRLGLKSADSEMSFAQTIVGALTGGMDTYSMIDCNWQDKAEGQTVDYLWRYFHTHRFKAVDSEADFRSPVIILDQFEEIFGYGEEAVSLFLKQLYELLADNLSLPSAEGWMQDTTFRIVLSIREDYLFMLEDYVDRLHLPLLKDNRFRLRPLSREEAEDVVLLPGSECIKPTDSEKVAQNIINASLQQDGEINSLMLSLICHQLYERLKDGETITADMTHDVSTSIQDYYKEAISGLPEKEREYIENFLVRDERRRRVDYKDFIDNVPHGEYLLGETVKPIGGVEANKTDGRKYKLLSKIQAGNEDGQVEIVHDQFARVIAQMKREMLLVKEQERRQKRMYWERLAGILIATLILIYLITNALFVPRIVTLEDCIEHEQNEIYRATIYDAVEAEEKDGVFRLQDVLVKRNAFRGNRNIRELHVGRSVKIEYGAFDDCPNLETIVFEGRHINIEIGAFGSQCKVKNIVVKKDASFSAYENSSYEFNSLENIEVEDGNTQCMTDPIGEAMRICFEKGYDGLITREYNAKLPRSWKEHVDNYHNNYIWCDTITLPELVRRGYNKDEYWYLVDNKVGHLPDADYKFGDFCKNVLIADLPHLDSIAAYMFYESELRTISAAEAKVIGHMAFYNSEHLKKIDFPSVTYTYQNILRGCSRINALVFPSLEKTYDMSLPVKKRLDRIELPNLRILTSRILAFDTISTLILPQLDSVQPNAFWNWAIDSLYINPKAKQRNEKFLLAHFKEEVSKIDTLCLYVHVGMKNIYTLSEQLSADNKVYLDHQNIRHLIIEKNDTADYIFDEHNYLQKISCSRKNKKYFVLNNALYRRSGQNSSSPILVAQNAERVILPYNFFKERSIYLDKKDSVKSVVLLNEWDIRKLYLGERKTDIDVMFLYGANRFISGLDYLPRNVHPLRMNMLQSMYYLFRCRFLLSCKQYPVLPILLLLLGLLIGLWPMLRKQIGWGSRSMWIYIPIYLILALVGGYVTVSAPMMYNKMFLRYVWVAVAYISAMCLARLAAIPNMKETVINRALQTVKVFMNLGILIVVTYIALLSINHPEDPWTISRSAVNCFMGVALVAALITRMLLRRKLPFKQQMLYQKLRLRYIIACCLLIYFDLFFLLFVLIDELNYGLSLALVILITLMLVIWIWNRNRVNREYGFTYSRYAQMRKDMQEQDVEFLSDVLIDKRIRIINWTIVIYLVLLFAVLLIFDFSDEQFYSFWFWSILLVLISLFVVDFVLRRKHLKYEDIVKQYKQEESSVSLLNEQQKLTITSP